MKKYDLLLLISFLLIIVGIMILTYYIYTEKVNECTSDPIKFGVEKIREMYNADSVYGEITFVKDYHPRSWYFGDEHGIIYLP